MRSTGAQILLQTLDQLNLEHIFAHDNKSLKWIFAEKKLIDHLQITYAAKPENTIYMASGFTRTTGKASVVLVPAGSGGAQVISGLVAAYLDSLPIICIIGQVPSSVLGTDAFQEADTIGMTQSCSKHNYLVKSSSDLQRILVEAQYLATTGRPGPIVINLPIDLLEQLSEVSETLPAPKLKGYKPVAKGHMGQIKKALELILQSEKPVLYCGGGAALSQVENELLQFAETFNIPVAQTLTGIGSFSGTHPLNLGLVGRGGHPASNMAANSADLLIAVGTRFNPHVLGQINGFRVASKVIHIDVDPSSIAKNTHVDVPIVGDAKDALKQILDLAKEQKAALKSFRDNTNSWHTQIQTWKKELQKQSDQKIFNVENIFSTLAKHTNNSAILICSDESLSLQIAQHYSFTKSKHWCPTGGMEVLGFSLSAAIGAQKANPHKTVIAVSSLKHLMMNSSELFTAIQDKFPIRVLLIDSSDENKNMRNIHVEDFFRSYGLGYSHCDQLKTFETQIKKYLSGKKAHIFDCENQF